MTEVDCFRTFCHRALVQPSLQSTLQGWGVASLDQDADDLLLLTKHLKAEFGSKVGVLTQSNLRV